MAPYSNYRERREMKFLVDRNLVGGSPYYTNFLEDLVPWFATTYGEETLGRSEALIQHVALETQENLMFFEQRCRDGSGVIVKYEDLSGYTSDALSTILKSFGLDHSDRVIRSMIDGASRRPFPEHVTSGSPSTEADSALTARGEAWISKYFAGFLDRFYPAK